MWRNKRCTIPILGILLLILSACGSVQHSPSPSLGDTITTGVHKRHEPAPEPPSPDDCDAINRVWNAEPKQDTPKSTAELTGVRVESFKCFDRVWFDLGSKEIIGYKVEYGPVMLDNHPVVVEGTSMRAILYAPGPWEPSRQLYAGPGRTVFDVKFSESHDGRSTFAIGTKGEHRFALTTKSDSNNRLHLVLDISHNA